jgi:hypothetical protein
VRFLEALGLVVLVLLLLLLAIYVRRLLLQRGGGTIELSLRLKDQTNGRGWVLGVGRFEGEELRWYRVFSLAVGPRRRLSRRDLRVTHRRAPVGGESLALLSGAVVMECSTVAGDDVMLAMDPGAVTGFMAWLESTPPGPR